ncbi:hypothetical protein SAMN05428979_0104 [Stappia sp. ES.058]|nr:hypothetical protein SAMN05428979_0104 [Stappia sp. ES.058]
MKEPLTQTLASLRFAAIVNSEEAGPFTKSRAGSSGGAWDGGQACPQALKRLVKIKSNVFVMH